MLKIIIFVLLYSVSYAQEKSMYLTKDDLSLNITVANGTFNLVLMQNDTTKLTGRLGIGFNITSETIGECTHVENCFQVGGYLSRIHVTADIDRGFRINWKSENPFTPYIDCYNMNSNITQWFGGPEQRHQNWPDENVLLEDFPYVPSHFENRAITEPYWLNSQGVYMYVHEKVPLFVDINNPELGEDQICFTSKEAPPYVDRKEITLNYTLTVKENAREAHLHAVKNYLGHPTQLPNLDMVKNPTWTTFRKHGRAINDSKVLELASQIKDNGYKGQISIDDAWETCYGTFIFSDSQFPDINNTIMTLHEMGFKVYLWIHPFVNIDCVEESNVGLDNSFFIYGGGGAHYTQWWNSAEAAARHFDFTNEEAITYFLSKLENIYSMYEIDGFRCDAGETSFIPDVLQSYQLHADVDVCPAVLTTEYISFCSLQANATEVRTGHRTQHLPIFVRMMDHFSVWGIENGLHAMVASLLQLNLAGYTFVLPDEIGGSGYNGKVDAELYIRWLQSVIFTPAIKFGILPWDFQDEKRLNVSEITKSLLELRETYNEYIVETLQNAVNNGTPVNPPIWWIDPTDEEALKCNSEYLLGEDILVAPILEKGATSRKVYLPDGQWIDGNNQKFTFKGKQTITYNATIEVLPYFLRKTFGKSSSNFPAGSVVLVLILSLLNLV